MRDRPKPTAFKPTVADLETVLDLWEHWSKLTPEQQQRALKELRAFAAGKPSALDKLPRRDDDA